MPSSGWTNSASPSREVGADGRLIIEKSYIFNSIGIYFNDNEEGYSENSNGLLPVLPC